MHHPEYSAKKPSFLKIALLALALGPLTAPLAAEARLRVVTTTETLAALTRTVGGEAVRVESLTRGYQDTHLIGAKPSFMFKLKRADLLIYQGKGLEAGWLPLVLQGSRNPDLLPGKQGLLDASAGIKSLGIPAAPDRAQGDIHPQGNPHYLLNPDNGGTVAEAITQRLGELAPAQAPVFAGNLRRFIKTLQGKISEWDKAMAPWRGGKVIAYHRTWSHFFQRFGLTYGGTLEPLPGIPPTPKHLTDLVQTVRQQKVRAIIQANYYEAKSARWLARQTGIPHLVLPPSVGAAPEADDYLTLFEYLVERLEKIPSGH